VLTVRSNGLTSEGRNGPNESSLMMWEKLNAMSGQYTCHNY
jgi:hypothetical protein